MMTDNPPATIASLHSDLKSGKYSCVDLINYYLVRIEKFDRNINSFITISKKEALDKGRQLDEQISKDKSVFDKLPLLGVVFSIKDIYLTKNIKTTAASKVLKNYIPQYSATVVEKLERAGAIVIGKANHDAWAHGASGENSDYGPTKNPWNQKYVPGGSSSGSAASVSAGFAFASMASDTGGSIRQPASFTNLVGLKPTYGAVSRYGVIAMASSLDSMGHMTRTVEDSEKIFKVTKGVDLKDATLGKKEKNTAQAADYLTVGIPKEYFIEGVDPEVVRSIESSIETLKKLGVEIKEVSLPHTKYAISTYYIIMSAEVSSNLARFDGVRYGNSREFFGKEAKRRIMLGSYVLSAGYYDAFYLRAMKVRTKISEDFEKVFDPKGDAVDAIIAPVSPTPAFKIGDKAQDPLQMYLADIFTSPASLAGLPGISVPAGFSSSGLPIGMQLLGPKFSENTLFEIGKRYQSVTDWHKMTAQLK